MHAVYYTYVYIYIYMRWTQTIRTVMVLSYTLSPRLEPFSTTSTSNEVLVAPSS